MIRTSLSTTLALYLSYILIFTRAERFEQRYIIVGILSIGLKINVGPRLRPIFVGWGIISYMVAKLEAGVMIMHVISEVVNLVHFSNFDK